jgi:hypothetical protein
MIEGGSAMHTRKIVLLRVFVNLSFLLALVTPTRIANAMTRPNYHKSSVRITQPTNTNFASYAGMPAYDSGWESLSIRPDPLSLEFTHNLGGDPDTYRVSLECRDNTAIGTYDCINNNFNVQAHWYDLTNSTVKVYVTNGSQPDGVRLRIFTDMPAYDGGWESISSRPDPIWVEFTHNLGGDLDTYQVSLECRDDTTLGTYDCTNDNFYTQALWYNPTSSMIRVYVIGGSQPDGVRIRIYTDMPAYDSGWESLTIRPDPISVQFTHNLGGDPDTYQVSLECRDDTALSTYDCTNSNFNRQAFWNGLTASIVNVYVSGGSQPDGVRLRIWRVYPIYLPIVTKPSG